MREPQVDLVDEDQTERLSIARVSVAEAPPITLKLVLNLPTVPIARPLDRGCLSFPQTAAPPGDEVSAVSLL